MTPETVEHLRADITTHILERRQEDPGLANDLLSYAVREIGALATNGHKLTGEHGADPQTWAALLLVAMQSRAVSGGWPYEQPPERPYELTLSDGDGDWG